MTCKMTSAIEDKQLNLVLAQAQQIGASKSPPGVGEVLLGGPAVGGVRPTRAGLAANPFGALMTFSSLANTRTKAARPPSSWRVRRSNPAPRSQATMLSSSTWPRSKMRNMRPSVSRPGSTGASAYSYCSAREQATPSRDAPR